MTENNDNNVEIDSEVGKKRFSFKAAIILIICLLFISYLLGKGLYSLKNNLFGNKNTDTAIDERSLSIDKTKININHLSPVNDKNVEPNDLNNSTYTPDINTNESKLVIKSLDGLSQNKLSANRYNNTTNDNKNINTSNSNDNDLTPSTIIKATFTTLDPNLSITKGTLIKCALTTNLISQVSGGIGCIINDDVYSENGNVLLIEKGAKVLGAYRRASINSGDNRIFVLWEEVRTPKGINISVNSGASDVLGGQGIDGYIDNHFWTRFGNAILVSMISDLSSSASTQLQKKDTYANFDNTTSSGAEVAKSIIEKSVDIPPTIYRNHGDSVAIYLNQDIDFSSVYRLEYKY